jgi:hypothetical protein
MPPELLKAHQALDKAVMKLYGFNPKTTEPEIVAELMCRYQVMTEQQPSLLPKEPPPKPKRKSRKSQR